MLRLTGGEFRGRSIQTPKNNRTRPTQAKLRQALFNSIQVLIPDARVLDLFAGSGALGFEALSRGAKGVTFVEVSRPVLKIIEKNAELLRVTDQIHLLGESIESVLPQLRKWEPFDIVLADPPYGEGWELKLLKNWPWQNLLSPQGYLCLEWGGSKTIDGELPDEIGSLVKVREKNYGESVLTTYRLKSFLVEAPL